MPAIQKCVAKVHISLTGVYLNPVRMCACSKLVYERTHRVEHSLSDGGCLSCEEGRI